MTQATDSVPLVGVIVMSYGSPTHVDEIEGYYTHIRRGRAPEPEQLADLIARYEAIGGVSKLNIDTDAQCTAIRDALDSLAPHRYTVVRGNKHAAPFVEDAVDTLVARNVDHIVGVVLAPHYSNASVGLYHDRARTAVAKANEVRMEQRSPNTNKEIEYFSIDSWWHLDAVAQHQANSLQGCLDESDEPTKVFFTAHSLPLRSLKDDPYVSELTASAQWIVSHLNNPSQLGQFSDWSLGWQSAGRTRDPWIGPDILESIADLAETKRISRILIVPQGFTSNHLEVAYDVDLEAAQHAATFGLSLKRTDVVAADAPTMTALAGLVHCAAEQRRSLGWDQQSPTTPTRHTS